MTPSRGSQHSCRCVCVCACACVCACVRACVMCNMKKLLNVLFIITSTESVSCLHLSFLQQVLQEWQFFHTNVS